MKIFQIGFNKCATLSLFYFFQDNGLLSIHYDFGGIACEIKRNIAAGNKKVLGKYEKYDFLCDMEFICDWDHAFKGVNYAFAECFKELDKAYQGSKFILNTRSLDKWLASRKNHAEGLYIQRYMNLYGFDESEVLRLWIREWYLHHSNVVEYFKERPDDLLILDLDAGHELCQEKLNHFFKNKFNGCLFGHVHKTKKAI